MFVLTGDALVEAGPPTRHGKLDQPSPVHPLKFGLSRGNWPTHRRLDDLGDYAFTNYNIILDYHIIRLMKD